MTGPVTDPDSSGDPADPGPPPAAGMGDEAVPDRRRPGTSDPHRSRRRALKVLFQADLRGQDPSEAVAGIAVDPAAVALLDDLDVDGQEAPSGRDGLDDYARALVDGVATNRHRLDEIIGRFSHRWEVGRMPVVDRNLLRIGVWELLYEQVAPAVVIDEAVELAKELSGDASHRFVNGILDSVRKESADLREEATAPEPEPARPESHESALAKSHDSSADVDDGPPANARPDVQEDLPADDVPADDLPADDVPADDPLADDLPVDDEAAVPDEVDSAPDPRRDEVEAGDATQPALFTSDASAEPSSSATA